MLRKKTKKKKPLTLFTKQKLHSKSTYFYSKWLDFLSFLRKQFTNGFWENLSSSREDGSVPNIPSAILTRRSPNSKSPYSKTIGWRRNYILPVVCSVALLLVLGLCINPVAHTTSTSAYAEGGGISMQADGDIVPEKGVALRIDTTLNDKDTVEEQVSGTGTQYIKVDFTVGANNIQNYDVYVQADSTALTGQSHGDKLQSITSDTAGTVGTMQWGYSVERGSVEPSTMTYKPIQTSAATSADGQDAGEGKTLTGISQPYTLAFAANLEGAASDHYKSNITLSVAAGAGEVVKTWSIYSMQEMTSSICSKAEVGTTGQLVDLRDNKTYWVTKLKDGNCWMTQNLAYDGGGIKEETTNFPDDTTARYYNPGQWVYSTPTSINDCDSTKVGLGACINNGWVNVTGWKAADNVNYTNVVDIASKTYDAHYLVGNYYSWHAATASDICPVGWNLPLNGSSSNVANGSFYKLFTSYGTYTGALLYGTQDIRTAPLYFVYGGYISNKSLARAGSQGNYWLSATNDTDNVYNLIFSTNVSPSSSSSASFGSLGFSVRCVAR